MKRALPWILGVVILTGVLVVGLLMLAVRRFAGNYLVDELVQDDDVADRVDGWVCARVP